MRKAPDLRSRSKNDAGFSPIGKIRKIRLRTFFSQSAKSGEQQFFSLNHGKIQTRHKNVDRSFDLRQLLLHTPQTISKCSCHIMQPKSHALSHLELRNISSSMDQKRKSLPILSSAILVTENCWEILIGQGIRKIETL